MENKIEIEICLGTSCHLMGSNLILDYLAKLPENIKKRIELKYISCMNQCKQGPRVNVDGVSIIDATPEKVNQMLEKKLLSGEGGCS